MPIFEYRGVTAGNRSARGMVDADNVAAARRLLRSDGIFPTQITPGRIRSPLSDTLSRLQLPQLRRVPDLDMALFSRQLATMLEAGVPLVESLGALTEQVENEALKKVVGRVRESVNHGSTLADALGEHPGVFNQLYRGMVHAGESSGALSLVLTRLADYIENQMELRNKVRGAMIYPALMLFVSAIVTGVLLVKVIPTITALLKDMNQTLPLSTLIVIGMSDFLVRWWLVIIVGITVLLLALNRAIQTTSGRRTWDRLRLGLPVVGRVVRLVAIGRFARTLSTLLAGGLSIVRALDISKVVAGNIVIGEAIDASTEAITRGASIAGPLRQSGEFPAMVTHMISVGEASGELEEMLGKVADIYDDLVENSLNRMTALLGPILLLVVAGVVVMVMLSTLLPLLNLTSAL
jgi:general secretion pathway protein F